MDIRKINLNIYLFYINIMSYSTNIDYEHYELLMDMYIEIILNLIDFSVNNKIIPIKMTLFVNYIKKYITENRLEMLDSGIKNILNNKDIILNFNITNLDKLEDDFNNISINNFNIENNLNDDKQYFLNLIIDIKNNSKYISKENINIIKTYFETIINILENINNLFLH